MNVSKSTQFFPLLSRKAAMCTIVFVLMTITMMMVPSHVARADDGTTPTATPAPVTDSGGEMGPLTKVDTKIREWGVYIFALLADLVVITVAIVGMTQALKAAGSGFLGAHGQTGAAIVGLIGLVLVVLITFVALPELVHYLSELKPAAPF